MPEWRKTDMQGQVIEMQITKQGIWWNCQYFSTGQWHCDDFDRAILGLPGELQAARALMVLACLFGFVGYVLSQIGLGCTTFMEENQSSKRKSKSTLSNFKLKIFFSLYYWGSMFRSWCLVYWHCRLVLCSCGYSGILCFRWNGWSRLRYVLSRILIN